MRTSRTIWTLFQSSVLFTLLVTHSVEAQDGQKIYQEFCSVCHGDYGDGQSRARQGLNPPPKDFTEPDNAATLTHELMLATVREGKPNTAMTGWSNRLSESEMVAVVDFVKQQFMRVRSEEIQAHEPDGKNIYADYCSVCHGDDGARAVWTGSGLNPPPRNFTDPSIRDSLSRKEMIAAVTHGKPDTAMVGFSRQLNNQDIENVVNFIRLAFMKMPSSDTKSASSTDDTISTVSDSDTSHGHDNNGHAHGDDTANALALMPHGLTGDAHSGGDFYRDNCATCHGVDGDGNGPRAYFINPKPTNFTDTAHRAHLDRPALFESIRDGVRGREMPAWSKVLDEQQIANVAEFVFTRFIQADDGSHSQHAHQ